MGTGSSRRSRSESSMRSSICSDPEELLWPGCRSLKLTRMMICATPQGEHSMKPHARSAQYSIGEEIANSLTHGLGALLAIGGLVVLVTLAVAPWRCLAGGLLQRSTALQWWCSTPLPRSITGSPRRGPRRRSRSLTTRRSSCSSPAPTRRSPWSASAAPGAGRSSATVWGLAAVGIILEIAFPRRWPALSLTLYIAMGWVVVVAVKPLLAALPTGGLVLLLLGGLSYTAGIGFYAWKRLPYGHAIWHLFVLAGTILHFFAVLLYVVPDVPHRCICNTDRTKNHEEDTTASVGLIASDPEQLPFRFGISPVSFLRCSVQPWWLFVSFVFQILPPTPQPARERRDAPTTFDALQLIPDLVSDDSTTRSPPFRARAR